MAVFAVQGSGRLNGLRTARTVIWIIAVRVSHPDLCVLRTGRWVGHHMARFHRPLTCTAPLPGEYASSALASSSKRARREIARTAAGSKRSSTPEKAALRAQHFSAMTSPES